MRPTDVAKPTAFCRIGSHSSLSPSMHHAKRISALIVLENPYAASSATRCACESEPARSSSASTNSTICGLCHEPMSALPKPANGAAAATQRSARSRHTRSSEVSKTGSKGGIPGAKNHASQSTESKVPAGKCASRCARHSADVTVLFAKTVKYDRRKTIIASRPTMLSR
eukprot:Amastigsp_a181208_7.p3 type:complete len:170 gc:universal Amastigsp_a181208_7:205-714(+)